MMSADQLIALLMELRRLGVRDARILNAIEMTPREAFLPKMFADRAYLNEASPISAGQTSYSPFTLASMLEALELDERHVALDVGTGSGYCAALLSTLVRRVYTIESHPELRQEAQERFAHLGFCNVTSLLGDGCAGWKDSAPFDRILVTGALPSIPSDLCEQLSDNGIMIIPVGSATEQRLLKVSKDKWNYQTTILSESVRCDPLIYCDKTPLQPA